MRDRVIHRHRYDNCRAATGLPPDQSLLFFVGRRRSIPETGWEPCGAACSRRDFRICWRGWYLFPEALVEVVEVAATLPEALGAETLKATVSEAMVLEPVASEAVV